MKVRFFTPRAPQAGNLYGAPGQGASTAISVATIFVLLGGWWLVTHLELIRPLFLPSPEMVISKFVKIACAEHYLEKLLVAIDARGKVEAACEGFGDHALHEHILWSLYRIFGSFFLATATAVPLGVAMGMSRFARGVFDPPIELYRPIPPLAYLPLTIIWFAPIALNARAGVRSVSVEQLHAAYSMGASRQQALRQVVLKGALPEILTGMRVAIAFGWTTLVAAEMVAAQAGIGVMVLNAARFLATDVVFLGIVVIGAVAFIFDLIMRRLERALVPWKGRA